MNRQAIIRNLKGVFPPVVTPFDPRGRIDEKRFADNLTRYTNIGLAGILVAGSTGEAPYLTAPERLRLIEIARRIVRPPEILMVGTGLESTRETLDLSREAVARGADVLLVLTPNYYKSRMDTRALAAHFRALASKLTRPLLIYNIPQFTGIRMAPDAFAELARHPNIVGLKESSGDLVYLRAILRKVPRNFRVFTGAASVFLDALRAGAVGGVLGQADFLPALCVGVYEAFSQGRLKDARELQLRLRPLVARISAPFGVAGIKAALDLCGYSGGNPRPPLVPLGRGPYREVAAAIQEARKGLAF